MMIPAVILGLTKFSKRMPLGLQSAQALSPATASAEKGPRHRNSEPGGRRVLERTLTALTGLMVQGFLKVEFASSSFFWRGAGSI